MDPEHIEPVRSLTLDRRSRVRTFLLALLPAFLLIGVIGAAIFGSGGSSDAPELPADRHVEAPISAAPQAQASEAPDSAGLREAGFPTRALGLPGLVAQGVQVAGPAYGALLDEWGEEFLAHGELDCRFVGMVTDGDHVTARIDISGAGATFEVANDTTGRTAVIGTARRVS